MALTFADSPERTAERICSTTVRRSATTDGGSFAGGS
jgi:hypothetical protein